jgi:hypothetical protein
MKLTSKDYFASFNQKQKEITTCFKVFKLLQP